MINTECLRCTATIKMVTDLRSTMIHECFPGLKKEDLYLPCLQQPLSQVDIIYIFCSLFVILYPLFIILEATFLYLDMDPEPWIPFIFFAHFCLSFWSFLGVFYIWIWTLNPEHSLSNIMATSHIFSSFLLIFWVFLLIFWVIFCL